ncbi:DUF72 domain-containing protein [Sphingomonas sp. R86521]|uniref:DUF72 domain-containing protein n=1 Tax=Sphingomonas sp. R86521 TaxID=3093860 RepID=UPI0036D3FB58
MRIGTAGWSIPTAFAGDFPSGGSHLERYASVFSAVEINSSFHRPHRRATYERWAASVPPDFRFSVKIPKTVSHTARLVNCDHLLDAFVNETGGLAGKLEIVLLQMPPSLVYDERIADVFFGALRDRLAKATQTACEPRHVSWFAETATACMISHRVARVAADLFSYPAANSRVAGPACTIIGCTARRASITRRMTVLVSPCLPTLWISMSPHGASSTTRRRARPPAMP